MENLTTPAGAHNRLQPIRGYLFKKGLTMSELSRRCQHKLSRGGVGYRVRVGDCMMADMADMAEAAGYKFVWHWENVRPVEPSPRAVRLPNKLHSELLRPVLTYLFEKNISVPDLAKKCGISKKDAEKAVTTTFDTIADALSQGDKVQLVGFGGFETKKREARMGRNPKTKEAIEIPATTIPVFKAGKALKEKTAK